MGVQRIRSPRKRRRGGGPVLGPMLKSIHRGPKGGGGGSKPQNPPPPRSASADDYKQPNLHYTAGISLDHVKIIIDF